MDLCDTEQIHYLISKVVWPDQPAVTCFYGVSELSPTVFPDPYCSQAFVVINEVFAVFMGSIQNEMEVVIHETVGDYHHLAGGSFTQLVTYRDAVDSGYEFFFRGVKYVSFQAFGAEMIVLFHGRKIGRNLVFAKDLRQTYRKFYVSGFEIENLGFVPTVFTPKWLGVWLVKGAGRKGRE